MNKSLRYVNLCLELHVVLTFLLGSYIRYFFVIFKLERPALKIHILWCRTDICSCKLSAKVSLMLDNLFPVLSLCKSNEIVFVSSRQAQKSPTNNSFLSEKAMFFWSDPRCFGLLGKFQHNIEISIRTARVSRLSLCFLWLWFDRKVGSQEQRPDIHLAPRKITEQTAISRSSKRRMMKKINLK